MTPRNYNALHLAASGGYYEQRVTSAALAFNGEYPNPTFDVANLSLVNRGARYAVATSLGSEIEQSGLIDPDALWRDAAETMLLLDMQIRVGSGVNWSVYLTSGLGDGTSLTRDDPANDMSVADGTGSKVIHLNMYALPGQMVRFVTAAPVGVDLAFIRVFVTPATQGRERIQTP